MSSSPRALKTLHVLLTCGLAAGLGFDEYRLVHARQEEAATQSAVAQQKQERAADQAKAEQLKERDEAYKKESEALRKQLADVKAGKGAPVLAGAPGDATKTDAEAGKEGKDAKDGTDAKGKAGFGSALAQMMKDPAMKKMMQQQQAMMTRMMYGELPKELGFDQQQSDQLMDILNRRQSDLTEKSFSAMDGTGDKSALAKQTTDINAQYDDQLKTLLGDSYPQFQAYEKTIADRAMMQQYQTQFSGLGQSLSDDQRAGLLQIMTEERATTPESPLSQNTRDVAGQIEALGNDGELHDFFSQQEDLNRRVLARASTVLTPEQVTSLANMQKQMMQMQEAGLNMSKQMFKPSK